MQSCITVLRTNNVVSRTAFFGPSRAPTASRSYHNSGMSISENAAADSHTSFVPQSGQTGFGGSSAQPAGAATAATADRLSSASKRQSSQCQRCPMFSHYLCIKVHGRLNKNENAPYLTSDHILSAFDHKEIALLCLLDLTRCLDVIDHSKLVQNHRLMKSTGPGSRLI